ncbi:hypothetical protein K449DRAFT_144556 [Hypoxylon sp. EC38]|nr:hypothetical protein K449DRAFT_144556 [Hypoxylon sp. EC38]
MDIIVINPQRRSLSGSHWGPVDVSHVFHVYYPRLPPPVCHPQHTISSLASPGGGRSYNHHSNLFFQYHTRPFFYRLSHSFILNLYYLLPIIQRTPSRAPS